MQRLDKFSIAEHAIMGFNIECRPPPPILRSWTADFLKYRVVGIEHEVSCNSA
jgi:hypothetical protein